jgi:hypothetical protein
MRRPAVVERLFDVGDDFPNGRSRTLGTPRLAKHRLVRLGGEQHGQSLDPPIGTIVYGHERVIYLGKATDSRWMTRRTTSGLFPDHRLGEVRP